MIPLLLLASGLALGARPAGLALVAGATYFPLPLAGLLVLLIWHARARPSVRSSEFCDAVAGELRSGDSLRNALARAAESVEADRVAASCRSSRPLEEVAVVIAQEFPDVGHELSVLVDRVSSGGTPGAELFEELGSVALAQSAVSQEISTATAPARATAAVLFGALVLGGGWALRTGGFHSYLGSPAQRAVSLVGLVLVIGGVSIAARMLMNGR